MIKMMKKVEEHRTLTKSERIRGLTIMVAIITGILFLAAGLVMIVFRAMVG